MADETANNTLTLDKEHPMHPAAYHVMVLLVDD